MEDGDQLFGREGPLAIFNFRKPVLRDSQLSRQQDLGPKAFLPEGINPPGDGLLQVCSALSFHIDKAMQLSPYRYYKL